MICDQMCMNCQFSECERERRQKETYRRYYQKHREKRLAYQHKYNAEHTEQIRAYDKKRWERKKSGN